MAGEHGVHPVRLQDGHDVLAHLLELDLEIRVVGALAVGRVVPDGEDPVLQRVLQVLLQPGQHGAPRRAIGLVGVEHHHVHVGPVEGVVRLRARGHAARLGAGGEREHRVVGTGLGVRVGAVPVVVPQRRPEHGAAQRGGVHVEHRCLVFVVRPVRVGVVPQHEPEVGVTASRPGGEGVAHAGLVGGGRPRVPQGPDTQGARRARCRGGDEGVGGEVVRRRPHRVVDPVSAGRPVSVTTCSLTTAASCTWWSRRLALRPQRTRELSERRCASARRRCCSVPRCR